MSDSQTIPRTDGTDGTDGRRQNWSGNVTYQAVDLLHPTSLDEVSAAVTGHRRVTALGSRHSFSSIADTDGAQLTLSAMPAEIDVDSAKGVARIAAGMTYASIAQELDRRGLALANMASLPHISIGGATATGTHGSGSGNASLASSVVGMEIVRGDGSVEQLDSDHPDLDAHRVSLGALGVITALDVLVEPSYDVAQTVHLGLPWEAAEEHFEDVMGAAYSVSMFTDYTDDIAQVWTKRRLDRPLPEVDLVAMGASAAPGVMHPVPGQDFQAVTEQGGVPGPWHERLPHFRSAFTPSAGEEIQCEYLLATEDAVPAMLALRGIASTLAPALMVSEIRRIAADTAWLAPSSGRSSVAFHFTFRRDQAAVARILPALETALAPFGARPHWGKVTTATPTDLRERYPALSAFADLADRLDEQRRFRNPYLTAVLG